MKQTGYTKVPDLLIDKLMKNLSEAELKILLTIIRQTIGWNKDKDQISHSQFKEKSGLSARSITAAIEALSNRNVIEITDLIGRNLPPDKRRYHKKIYYKPTDFTKMIDIPIKAKLDKTSTQNLPLTIYSLNRQQETHKSDSKIKKQSDQQRISCVQNQHGDLSCSCFRCF